MCTNISATDTDIFILARIWPITETVSEHKANTKMTDAAEASTVGNEAVKVLLQEPLDEIEMLLFPKKPKYKRQMILQMFFL